MLLHAQHNSIIDSPRRRQNGLSRITPRTCLWPLVGSLVATFCLSIGLTFRSDHQCYAGTCGEWLFPLQTRLHVAVWYAWLSISVIFLAVRAFHPEMQKSLARSLVRHKIPVIRKHLTISGAITISWTIALYVVIIGIWWMRLRNYFVGRGKAGGIFHGGNRLAAVALTGHFCDVTMGMVLIPISRHSALASFFKLSVSTTLTLHMTTAYTLFILVLLHGLLYASWIPIFHSLSQNLRMVYPVLNPTYLYLQAWPGNTSSLGVWRASLIFSGLVAVIIMSTIFLTTLPAVRTKHFNLFYFTHFLSIVMVIVICLHASTMFYCTAPGLAMWSLDWGMRLYELRRALDGQITTIGNGWYWYVYESRLYSFSMLTSHCVTIPLPRQRLSGCSCRSPLAHFYIHHSDSSIRELHPFTTITHLASQDSIAPDSQNHIPIQFLFRKRGNATVITPPVPAKNPPFLTSWTSRIFRTKKQRIQSIQWTDKLASLVDHHALETTRSPCPKDGNPQALTSLLTSTSSTSRHPTFPTINVALRLEGPYFSPTDPFRYGTVVCLVAGTGVSGAIAIADAFTEMQQSHAAVLMDRSALNVVDIPTVIWDRCVVVWSIHVDEYVDLPFFKGGFVFHCQCGLMGKPPFLTNLTT